MTPPQGRWPQVLAAAVLMGIALVWYSFAIPLWQAPDERGHVDLVLDVARDSAYPAWDENRWRQSVVEASILEPGPTGRTHFDGDAVPPRADRPSFTDLGGDQLLRARNPMAQHPPAYYVGLGLGYRVFEALVDEDAVPADRSLSVMRLLNLPLIASLPAVCWWAARRCRLEPSTAILAALVPLCVPGLAQIGSAVNNDNLLTVALGVATALSLAVALGDRSLRTAAGLGGAVLVALLTKGFGVVAVPGAVLAYGLCARRAGGVRHVLRPAATCALLTAVGLAWYVRNLVRYGNPNPSLDVWRFEEVAGDRPIGPWAETLRSFLVDGFWGRPGPFVIDLPTPYTTVATTVWLGVVGLGAASLWRRGRRGEAALLALPFLALLVGVAANSYRLYVPSGTFAFMHGRYLLAGITGLAVLFATGLGRLLGHRGHLGVPLLLVAAAVMHRMALLRLLGTFWDDPAASLRDQVVAAARWSPWSGSTTVALAVLSVVAAAGAIWVLVAPSVGIGRSAGRRTGTVRSP